MTQSRPRDSISRRFVDPGVAARIEPEIGVSEVARGDSDLQKELAEVLRERVAISAMLRAIARSPHDLQPIFDTILDSAVRLCRADCGTFRLVEEAGVRLVAHKAPPGLPELPMLRRHDSFIGPLFERKSPVHIPDLAAHLERNSLEEPDDRLTVSRAVGTVLFVPMLKNDDLIGSIAVARQRVEPFTKKEIELVTDFAAQAAIALGITRCERELRELQMQNEDC
jgi:GAF domain-containing protein